MGSDKPPLLGLFGIGSDNRIPARVDLHDDLNLVDAVDRLELGGVLLFGQLILLGLFTNLPITAQVGIAGLVVIVLDLLDRKLLARYLD
ncbi:hypothetical protein [Natronomonas sp.]|jgi:hypothetical protein|uniref:hypothetical protein n=1 Tax=Natronomonas sp. TaxID=2184060 RepID=UPI002FC311BF